nr:cuticle collagen 39 [Gorilla gorilla gorilla]
MAGDRQGAAWRGAGSGSGPERAGLAARTCRKQEAAVCEAGSPSPAGGPSGGGGGKRERAAPSVRQGRRTAPSAGSPAAPAPPGRTEEDAGYALAHARPPGRPAARPLRRGHVLPPRLGPRAFPSALPRFGRARRTACRRVKPRGFLADGVPHLPQPSCSRAGYGGEGTPCFSPALEAEGWRWPYVHCLRLWT